MTAMGSVRLGGYPSRRYIRNVSAYTDYPPHLSRWSRCRCGGVVGGGCYLDYLTGEAGPSSRPSRYDYRLGWPHEVWEDMHLVEYMCW